MNRQRHLDILHIVLRKGEYTLRISLHARRCSAAAPAADLEIFPHFRPGQGCDFAAAGDKSIGIELAAGLEGNGAALLHLDLAIRPGVGAGAGILCAGMLAANRNDTAIGNRDACSRSKGQLAIQCRWNVTTFSMCRLYSIDRVGRIKGDQQGNAGGDGIFSCGQGAGLCNNNHAATGLSRCNRRCKIGIVILSYGKDRGICWDKPGCYCSRLVEIECGGRIHRQDCIVLVFPAKEFITWCRGSI